MTDRLLEFPSAKPDPTKAAPDLAARLHAVDSGRSVLVQAPAGSGKTMLLSERFLRLLPTVEEPEQILAITFTRAAASEMRSRILQALRDAQENKAPRNDGEARLLEAAQKALAWSNTRGWNLVDDPQQMRIETMDVLARQIAQQTPLTSRLGPGFAPTESPYGSYMLAASRTLRALKDLRSDDPWARQTAEAAATLLRHRDNNLQHCMDLLAGMLANRDQWGRVFPIQAQFSDDESMDTLLRPRLEGYLRSAIESHLGELSTMFRQRSEMCRRLLALARFAASTATSEIVHCKDIATMPPPAVDAVLQWRGIASFFFTEAGGKHRNALTLHEGFPAQTAKVEKQAALALIEEMCSESHLSETLLAVRNLPPASYTDEEWHVAKALFRLLQRAVVELKLIFAEQGLVDFVEVVLAAQQALVAEEQEDESAPSDLALTLSGHYRHLLVDEFQDTSLTQFNLLRQLLKGWSGEPERTVFFVGDPMQSIYLFRQAELEIFHRVRQEGIAEIPVEAVTLSTNFRSQPALVEEHNRIFRDVFAGAGGIQFAASQSALTAAHHPALSWHFFRKPPRDAEKRGLDKAAADVAEAERALEIVQKSLKDEHASVAILVRAKHHAGRIMQLLRDEGIAYRAIEMESLSDRQEVLDVFALTRALLHPADRVAWLSVLRAPWCGLTLASLDALAGYYPHATVPDLLQTAAHTLPQPDRLRALHTAALVDAAVRQRAELRLPALLWNTWRQLNGPACVNAEQRENVLTYLAMLERMDAQGEPFRCDSIQREMDHLCARPNPDPAARVEILTIHKSKGLEFDTVIVPQMHRSTGRTLGRALEWMEQGLNDGLDNTPWYLAPIAAKGSKSSTLARWIAARRTEREQAEEKRLFYVAATRARRDLHLLGSLAIGKTGINKPTSGTLLRAAWCVAEAEAERQLSHSEGLSSADVALAAVAEPDPLIQRLPDEWFALAPAAPATPPRKVQPITKPREVMAASRSRLSGIALHLLLEQAASQRAGGKSWQQIAKWADSARSALQARLLLMGMRAGDVEKSAANAIRLLGKVLGSQNGQWILENHERAQSEIALTHMTQGVTKEVRLDRIFAAGSAPLSVGSSDLWIIDYKSATTAGDDVAAFLATQAAAYAATMQQYAEALRLAWTDGRPVHYALYFPALDELHELGTLP